VRVLGFPQQESIRSTRSKSGSMRTWSARRRGGRAERVQALAEFALDVLKVHVDQTLAPTSSRTAAHCTDFFTAAVGDPEGFGVDDLRVSFDPDPDETSTYYLVDHLVVHPGWFNAGPCLGNSKMLCLAPPAEDIALVWLTESVAGVDPAPVADAGYLDGLDLMAETFTVVGYGVDEFITGNIIAPNALIVVDGIRSYRDVSVITTHDAFPDRFIKYTQSTCFGDSGGPLFHDGTVVGINTWTFSPRCSGPNFAYRTDSAVAQEFLDTYL
jgi:hypothetical protein